MTHKDYTTWSKPKLIREVLMLRGGLHIAKKEAGHFRNRIDERVQENQKLRELLDQADFRLGKIEEIRSAFHG